MKTDKLSEIQAMIAGVCAAYPVGRERVKALKACQWRLRGPCGEFVGMGDIHTAWRGCFVPESQALIFDGRDNEAMKLAAYEHDLGPLTVEIIPQLVGR